MKGDRGQSVRTVQVFICSCFGSAGQDLEEASVEAAAAAALGSFHPGLSWEVWRKESFCSTGHPGFWLWSADRSGWTSDLCRSLRKRPTDVSRSFHLFLCGKMEDSDVSGFFTGRQSSWGVTHPRRLPMMVWRIFLAEIWPRTFL